jgi:hypothetical protein
MTIEIKGTLKLVTDKQVVSDKFIKREIVVSIDNDTNYPQPILIQLGQKILDVVDQFKAGQEIKASCNLRGRAWDNQTKGITQYFNSLEAWKVEADGVGQSPTAQTPSQDDGFPHF